MKMETINNAKRSVKRILYGIFNFNAPREKICWNLLDNKCNENKLNELTDEINKKYHALSLEKSENSEYFDGLLNYIGKAEFLEKNPFFLYPSNVAVLDFILKNISAENKILEYACGLGNLLVYLKRLGFENIKGYDNFSQIKKGTILNFLKQFNAENIILGKNSALNFQPNIVICIAYFWEKLDKDFLKKEINNDKLNYILIDYDYAPREIPGFKVYKIYNNLLVIFKRNHG